MYAIVAPGQGAQTPGFLTSWLERDSAKTLLTQLSEAAQLDLQEHGTVSDADTIRDTAVAQPLLVASGILALDALFEGQAPEVAPVWAGHSVGEVTAAAGAGVLTPQEAMSFVRVRSTGMAQAAAAAETTMVAVLGGDEDEVLAAIAAANLTPANRNSKGQIVAAGSVADVIAFQENPPAGARVRPLQVAGAFHTSYMEPAIADLAAYAATLTPAVPHGVLLSNRDGEQVADGPDAVARMVQQVSAPVRWDLCSETLTTLGVTALIELPPAGTLVGIARRALPDVETLALKSPEDLPAARELIARHSG